MSTAKIEQEYRAILELMASCQQNVSINEMSGKLEIPIPRRTLQRRLAQLVETGQLISHGEKRGRRYSLARPKSAFKSIAEPTAEDDTYIRQWAEQYVPQYDRVRFVEMAETELTRLHEGNIARHQLRPDEFAAWQKFDDNV